MKAKLVADSSANHHTLDTMDVTYVPLKIITDEKEYTDNSALDAEEMLAELSRCKGNSGTACPGAGDWLNAFEGADTVLGVSITSGLSGSYNAAVVAAEEYRNRYPDARVFILDTLSTGPEMQLILEKYHQLLEEGKDFDEICAEVKEYLHHTHLIFSLASLDNFAKNGRVSPAVAKAVGILGIRVVGRASDEGTLESQHKCRGEKRALRCLVATMKEMGYHGGKVRITHTFNEKGASSLASSLKALWPEMDLSVSPNRGLCSYYAEMGGILVAFES
ncbi:MAG: DegV family protein [Clostridia bacterium]